MRGASEKVAPRRLVIKQITVTEKPSKLDLNSDHWTRPLTSPDITCTCSVKSPTNLMELIVVLCLSLIVLQCLTLTLPKKLSYAFSSKFEVFCRAMNSYCVSKPSIL